MQDTKSNDKAVIARNYDEMGPNYSKAAKAHGWQADELGQRVKTAVSLSSGKVFDMGCGDGVSSHAFLQDARFEVYGTDLSSELVKLAQIKSFAEVKVHDLDHTFPFADDFFDLAISFGVLEFVDDLDHVFSEAARVLRPGGYLYFTVEEQVASKPSQESPRTEAAPNWWINRYTEDNLCARLNKAGFKVQEVSHIENAYSRGEDPVQFIYIGATR